MATASQSDLSWQEPDIGKIIAPKPVKDLENIFEHAILFEYLRDSVRIDLLVEAWQFAVQYRKRVTKKLLDALFADRKKIEYRILNEEKELYAEIEKEIKDFKHYIDGIKTLLSGAEFKEKVAPLMEAIQKYSDMLKEDMRKLGSYKERIHYENQEDENAILGLKHVLLEMLRQGVKKSNWDQAHFDSYMQALAKDKIELSGSIQLLKEEQAIDEKSITLMEAFQSSMSNLRADLIELSGKINVTIEELEILSKTMGELKGSLATELERLDQEQIEFNSKINLEIEANMIQVPEHGYGVQKSELESYKNIMELPLMERVFFPIRLIPKAPSMSLNALHENLDDETYHLIQSVTILKAKTMAELMGRLKSRIDQIKINLEAIPDIVENASESKLSAYIRLKEKHVSIAELIGIQDKTINNIGRGLLQKGKALNQAIKNIERVFNE